MRNSFLLFYFFSIFAVGQNDLNLIENQLYKEIQSKEKYDKQKEEKIASLFEKLANNPQKKFEIQQYIFEEYEFYKFDSALFYAKKNLDFSTKFPQNEQNSLAKINMASLLISSGRYTDATVFVDDLMLDSLANKLKVKFLKLQLELYSRLDFYNIIEDRSQVYRQKYTEAETKLYKLIPEGSYDYFSLLEKKLRDQRKLDSALMINDKRLKLVEEFSRNYAITMFEKALNYNLLGDDKNEKKYLMLSAIADIKSSIKDNASTTELANIEYENGELLKAHDLIQSAMEDADFYNSHLRYVNISHILPVITKSYEYEINQQKNRLRTAFWLISILSFILLGILALLFKQFQKQKKTNLEIERINSVLQSKNQEISTINDELNKSNIQLQELYHQLQEIDEVKEEYIGTFINLYSEFLNKLDLYQKMVKNYIKANKINSLLQKTESNDALKEELNHFYQIFDESFLRIHPYFIEEFNKLLKPDNQFTIEQPNKLNTELRIFALIRLGIDQSSQIAKILRYSVNTIYNYRAQVKNSAINRDTFESEIKAIR